MIKTVLYITDDFADQEAQDQFVSRVSSGQFFTSGNWLEFKVTVLPSLETFVLDPDAFDIALVDYGLVGECPNPLAYLSLVHKYSRRQAWCGALPGDMIKDDLRRLFPTARHLHKWPSCDLGASEVLDFLYRTFESERP